MSLKHVVFSSTTFLTHFSCSLSTTPVRLVYIVEFINQLCCSNDPNNQETDYIKRSKDDGKKKQNILFLLGKTLHVLFNDKCLFELNVIQPVINMSVFPSHMANFPWKSRKKCSFLSQILLSSEIFSLFLMSAVQTGELETNKRKQAFSGQVWTVQFHTVWTEEENLFITR